MKVLLLHLDLNRGDVISACVKPLTWEQSVRMAAWAAGDAATRALLC